MPAIPGLSALSRKARISLIALAVALALYTALGVWLVPRIVRAQLLGFIQQHYQRDAQVGEIRFNPFTLKLDTRAFSLPDADGARLVGFERLLLDFELSSIWKRGASFAAIDLERPYVRALLRPDGALNLGDLTMRDASAAERPVGDPVRVFIDRLSVREGHVAFEDRSRAEPFATALRPITFELRDFATAGQSGNGFSLRGASVSDERFACSGTFSLAPLVLKGEYEVRGLKAATISSYLQDAVAFEFSRGSIDLDGRYLFDTGDAGGLRLDVDAIELADLGLRPKGAAQDYVELTQLSLTGSHADLRRRELHLGALRLDGGLLRVARDAQGNINLAQLAGPAQADAPEKGEGDWIVAAPDIALAGLAIEIDDELVRPGAKFSLTPVSLDVKGFSTAPGSELTLQMQATGPQAGELAIRGSAVPHNGSLRARADLKGLDLAALQPYLATYTQVILRSGWLEAGVDVERTDEGVLTAAGDVAVSRLFTVDNALKQDLVKWDRVAVSGLEWRSEPARLRIARIDARAPYARLVIAADQSLNIARLFEPTPGSAPAPVQTVRADGRRVAPGGNPGAMDIRIGTLKVTNGSVNFADYWITPNYAVAVQELTGGVTGLSSEAKSRAKVDFEGKVDRYAPARISGEMNLLSAALYTDIHVKLDGVEMTSVTPYSGHFAGYAIEKGKLSIDVNYQVENRRLEARQKFVVDQLTLGDRIESPDAVKLPLKLAVALLKDRNGVIDIDLPMSGSLDDPQFRMGPLIWKAFVGLLTKVATSPFTLLARLGGREDEINRIDFAPGSSALDALAQERMTALAKAFAERPSLQLEIPTVYSAELDARALAAARVEETLAAAGVTSSTADPARFDALRKLYEKGAESQAPLPSSAAAVVAARRKRGEDPPYEAAIQELLAALAARQPASDAELAGLARARTDAIREALLGADTLDAARVFVLGARSVAPAEGLVRVELALR